MNNRKEVKQKNKIRVTYNQLSGEEKKIYWENFKMMAKPTQINDEIPPKFDQDTIFITCTIDL